MAKKKKRKLTAAQRKVALKNLKKARAAIGKKKRGKKKRARSNPCKRSNPRTIPLTERLIGFAYRYKGKYYKHFFSPYASMRIAGNKLIITSPKGIRHSEGKGFF